MNMRQLIAAAVVVLCSSTALGQRIGRDEVTLPQDDPAFRVEVEIDGKLDKVVTREILELTVEAVGREKVSVCRWFVITDRRKYLLLVQDSRIGENAPAPEGWADLIGKSVRARAVIRPGSLLNTGRINPHSEPGSFHFSDAAVTAAD